jgi:hypothetical protein
MAVGIEKSRRMEHRIMPVGSKKLDPPSKKLANLLKSFFKERQDNFISAMNVEISNG